MTEQVKLTLGDGSIIVGHTLEEAFENLGRAKEPVKTPAVPQPHCTRSIKFDRDANRVK